MIITWIIIGLTALVSVIAFSNGEVSARLLFSPYLMARQRGEWFRFVSIGFVHGDWGHLLGNMLSLFFFGRVAEQVFSPVQYILLYLGGLVLSAAPMYQKHKDDPAYSAVGASGAVSAVIFSTVLYAPWNIILLKFFIPLPFIVYALGYLGYSSYMARKGSRDGIAHDAHFWGALWGVAFTLLTHPGVLGSFLAELMHPKWGI